MMPLIIFQGGGRHHILPAVVPDVVRLLAESVRGRGSRIRLLPGVAAAGATVPRGGGGRPASRRCARRGLRSRHSLLDSVANPGIATAGRTSQRSDRPLQDLPARRHRERGARAV